MNMTQACKREGDDALRQPADIHQFTGEQEERHRQELEVVRADDHVLRHDLAVEIPEPQHERERADDKREGNRHAQRHGSEQGNEENDDRHSSRSLKAWASSSSL
jgi:hypothetical protein